MANKLGMRTLSEGVEDQEEKDFLASVKCERLQGYLFGKPMRYEDLLSKINNRDFTIAKELI